MKLYEKRSKYSKYPYECLLGPINIVAFLFFPWCNSAYWARSSSLSRFLHHKYNYNLSNSGVNRNWFLNSGIQNKM